MVTLTPVEVTLPDDKIPTQKHVKDIISTFLTKEWPFVDQESISLSFHSSFANSHCIVERPQPPGSSVEPTKVFIKFHKGNVGDLKIFEHLAPTKLEEANICYEYSLSGSGAKVHGFFRTQDGTVGRIDEFLDARTSEPEDAENAMIRADIAREMAIFHSLAYKVKEKTVESYYKTIVNGLDSYHKMDKLKALGREGGVAIDELIDYDFGTKLQNVIEQLELIRARSAWCIHDVQFMNVMVKNNPQEESKVALIDFEFVMRNYRAFDIGGHFMQKMFKWFDEENKIANCRKYTEDEKRHFCDEYAKQWNKMTGDSDTGDQLFLESEYGYLLAITFDIHNMLCFMNHEEDRDALNLRGLNKLFDEFVGQYSNLNLKD